MQWHSWKRRSARAALCVYKCLLFVWYRDAEANEIFCSLWERFKTLYRKDRNKATVWLLKDLGSHAPGILFRIALDILRLPIRWD